MMHDQAIFRAIADPTRRQVISLLAKRDMTVSDVASRFDMSRPAVAKHLGILQAADLIRTERKGREVVNRLNPEALKSAADWLDHFSPFWDDKLMKLKHAVENDDD